LGNLSTPASVRKLQRALYAKAKSAAGYRFYALYDKMYREDILAQAYAQCRSNKGAPGVDGQDFADITLDRGDAVVYHSIDLHKGTWTEIKRERNAKGDAIYLQNLSAASAVLSNNRYIFMTASGAAHVLNLLDRTWTSSKAPFAAPFTTSPYSLRAHSSGFIYALGRRSPYITTDFGNSWKEESTGCLRIMSAWYGKNGAAYNLCFQGAFVVSTSIQKKETNATTWKAIMEETPVMANAFFASDTDDFVMYVSPEGLIHTSIDGGVNWKLERKTY
jgi:hypothetical protein